VGLTRRQLLAASGLAAAGLATGCETAEKPSAGRVSFPEDFRVGMATSAYQIEGAVRADGRGPSIWDTFCARAGAIDDGSSGEIACDHYRRWESDLDLLQRLRAQSYRFSIAWPRVLPEGRGAVNQRGLDFYRRLVDGLKQRGIDAVATLFHWDLPQVLQDGGGWENRDCASWFADYATAVFDGLDGVDIWLTINEPKIIVQQGYQLGWMAPGLRDNVAAGTVIHHLGLAHGLAVQSFAAAGLPGAIGACHVLSPVYPADESAGTRAQVSVTDAWENTLYLDPVLKGSYPRQLASFDPDIRRGLESAIVSGDLEIIASPVDLLGLNYYSPIVIDASGQPVQRYPVASNGWQQVHASGLYDVLIRLHGDYDVDVVITENGLPDDTMSAPVDDQSRIDFLRDHLLAVRRAMADGASVLGYHAWSLLDNFEWARGYTQRWGLVHVDFDTQRRTPKASARWLADVINQRSVPER
jgi:beta-glucosidase